MNLETEIIEAIKQTIQPDFSLSNNPILFYSKNGFRWIRVSMSYRNDDYKIRYIYHGFLNEAGLIHSRDCHSERHFEISNRITEELNSYKIGKKLNAHFLEK